MLKQIENLGQIEKKRNQEVCKEIMRENEGRRGETREEKKKARKQERKEQKKEEASSSIQWFIFQMAPQLILVKVQSKSQDLFGSLTLVVAIREFWLLLSQAP